MGGLLIDKLTARGCSGLQAERLEACFTRLAPGGMDLFVPGRVELVGKHVDYAGGSSITMATSRGFAVRARWLSEPILRLIMHPEGRRAELPLERSLQTSGWLTYPATVIRRVLANVPDAAHAGGVELQMYSTLPQAAGMSSSSAFMTAIFLGWAHGAKWIGSPVLTDSLPTDQALADYVATIENGRDFGRLAGDAGVGTVGGSQDHTAIIRSTSGDVARYRYIQPRDEGRWALPSGYGVTVLTTGVEAQKTGRALEDYNQAASRASALSQIWNASGPQIPGIGFLSDREADELAATVQGILSVRLNAFRSEQAAVEAATRALEEADREGLAHAVNHSQEAAEALLGNQIPETVHMCRMAREAGALAATSFGAGFGGAVWALVADDHADMVIQDTLSAFRARFTSPGMGFREAPGPGAFFLDGRPLRG